MGKTILISSHILSELRYLCNTIGILEDGDLIYSGTIADALKKARTRHRLEIRLVDRVDDAVGLLEKDEGVVEVYEEDGIIVVELPEGTTDFSFVAARLVTNGFSVLTIREEEILLEDAFIKLTGAARLRPATPPPMPPATVE